jgi:hypothetical protein
MISFSKGKIGYLKWLIVYLIGLRAFMRLVKNTSEFVCEGISREDYLRKEDPL